jgi:hypothetical protein
MGNMFMREGGGVAKQTDEDSDDHQQEKIGG